MRIRISGGLAAALVLSGLAVAQPAKPTEDHSTHAPSGAAPAATAPAGPTPEAMNRQMKTMQDMHQKMQAAKTPAERARLMDEHMKLMQSGMAMMGQMRGTGAMGGAGGPGYGGMQHGAPGGRHPGGMPPGAQGTASQPSPGGGTGMSGMMGMHTQMERRMALMEQMMQMMVDREAARTGP